MKILNATYIGKQEPTLPIFKDAKFLGENDPDNFSVIYNSFSGITYELALNVDEAHWVQTLIDMYDHGMYMGYMNKFLEAFTNTLENYLYENILNKEVKE